VSERMGPIDSIMWGIGQDATLRMNVGNLIILDGAPTRTALAERLGVVAEHVPRLRQRPDVLPGLRTRPAWVDDEGFDAGDHVRTVAVASPGDQRQVLDLVALLEPAPFDPRMSPWDLTIIEGLAGGRAALYLRAHHSLTDGLRAVSLVRLFLDESATPAAPVGSREPVQSMAPVEGAGVAGDIDSSSAPDDRRKPGTVNVTIDLAGAVRPIANGVTAALRIDPVDAVVRGVQRGLDVANSVSRQVVVTGGRLSPLSSSRSMTTRYETMSVPGARATARALGGSRNDLLVAGAAMGVGRYHTRLGMSCRGLRLASPARHRAGSGGSVVPTRVEIPVSNGHPGPMFGVVAERLARSRREPALHVTDVLASAISHLPARIVVSAMRAQASTVDFVATSLPGICGVRHICGAVIEESFPFGPRLGSLMNITGFGVDDRLDIGIGLDPTAVAEPEMLVECMVDAFQSFASTNGS
jgi:diacylglycerol O-acyltransferase / wax synthase